VPGHHFTTGFDLTLRPDKLALPLTWRRPRRIFVNSMSDLFHADVPDDYIAAVFAVMATAHQHTYQVLTKRHARMRVLLASSDFTGQVAEHVTALGGPADAGWPLRNVWLGVSVEDQRWADTRVPALVGTPAAVRFLSCEPLLGPVDLTHITAPAGAQLDCLTGDALYAPRTQAINWVIVGGESGPGARPMHPTWARDLRDQCQAAHVPFLFKQWGMWRPASILDRPDRPVAYREMNPGQHPMVRVGKHAAGRVLDGRTWTEFPDTTTAGEAA
jgi:protein gp37